MTRNELIYLAIVIIATCTMIVLRNNGDWAWMFLLIILVFG